MLKIPAQLAAAAAALAVAMGGVGAASARAAEAPSSSFGVYAAPPAYPERLTTSRYVTMRDGVRLAVSVTVPAVNGRPAPGQFPVVWTHALNIAAPGLELAPSHEGAEARRRWSRDFSLLAHHGYVVAVVARRGHAASFGQRRGYNDRTESYDAYEVIDWLAAQPWSTGKVAVYGCSNTGDAALNVITAGNPHLKAAWVGAASWERYDGFFRGGIMANWGTGPQASIEEDVRTSTPVEGDAAKVLLRKAAEDHVGNTPLQELWLGMPFRDSTSPLVNSRFWYETSVGSYRDQVNRSGVPVYLYGGWYDDQRQPSLTAYANLTGERRFLMGPWLHCNSGDLDLMAEVRRFFDLHLKGIKTGIADDPPIHYFTVNAPEGSQWRTAQQWPPAGTQKRSFYLAGQTLAAKPAQLAPVSFAVRYDVDCPPHLQRGAETSRSMPGRNDGTNPMANSCFPEWAGPHFLSAPLPADTEVTGSPVADIWISSSARDQNVFVYLEDVAADGATRVVTDGRLKASLRKTNVPPYAHYDLPWHRSYREDAAPLTPGEPVLLSMDLLPVSYVFRKGHRMRVTIAGADYRERIREPVSPAPTLSIWSERQRASLITLPIMDAAPDPSRP